MFQEGMKEYKAEHSEMISKDRSKVANMPQEVIQKEYASPRKNNLYGVGDTAGGIDDSIKGVDDVSKDSISKMKRNKSKSMY